jgi:L-fuculose-phosphate aldolase
LDELKRRLIEAAVRAEENGLCKHRSGNFSILDKTTGLAVISPSGLERKSLRPEDIPVIALDGSIVETAGGGKPSTEYPLHIRAYQTRSDISSVVHTHSPYATAFAIKGKEIKPVVFEALFYGVDTAVAEYARPGTRALAESVVAPLAKADVCLLKNHGVLVVGNTIEETLLKALYVEDVAKIYLLSLCPGGIEPDEIPREEFETYKREMGMNRRRVKR